VKERVLTALVLAPIVLAVLLCTHPAPFLVLAILIIVVAWSEIAKMLGGQIQVSLLAILAGLLIALNVHESLATDGSPPLRVANGVLEFVAGIAGTYWAIDRRNSNRYTPIALFWVVGPLMALLTLHQAVASEHLWEVRNPVLLAILPLWAGDIAAIFAGRAWGRHPLAPKISPKKTWEGGIANFVAATAVAVPLGLWLGLDVIRAVLCGAAAGILGQAGDLFESYVKRKAGLKDSGTLLPGHGGIMDRIDSILFTAPFTALIVILGRQ